MKTYVLIEMIAECQVTLNKTKVLATSKDKQKLNDLLDKKAAKHIQGFDITLEELKKMGEYYADDSEFEYSLDQFTHTCNEVYDYGSEILWSYHIQETETI